MRRLIFLLCLSFLVTTLTVGCSSKKRARRKSDSDNTEQQANANTNNENQAENKSADEPAAEGSGNAASSDIGGNSNTAQARPRGMRPGDNLAIGGGPPAGSQPAAGNNRPAGRQRGGMRPGDNLAIGGGAPGSQPVAAGGNRPAGRRRGGMRPGDNLAIGGGAPGSRPVAAGGRRAPAANNNQPGNSQPVGETFAGGGLLNGFYPQPSTGGVSFAADGTLPNGFFPQPMSGGAGGPVVAAPLPKQKPSVEFRETAKSGFQERDNAKAMSNLWGYMVANDENIKKFPVRYFPGMSSTSGALRWGVGVVYNNRSDDSRPLVIGDPEGFREVERTASRGRGSRSTRGSRNSGGAPGGMESLGGNTPARTASSSGSDYAMVNVEHPEGFLLYYTGDYGDKFLDRLASRIHHPEGFYGDVYREFVVDYSNEKQEDETSEISRPANNSLSDQRRARRNRDNLSVGGGAGGRGRAGNRRAGGGGGGGAAAADSSDRMKRLMTGDEADAPPSDTTGLLMPGVFLVGEGKRDELTERAKNLGLDVLVIFNVRVSNARRSVGSANIKVYSLRGEEPEQLASGRSLKSDKVAEQREGLEDSSRDPVALALDEIFTKTLDESLKGIELPEDLKTDPLKLKDQIEAKVANKPSNVLPLMHEILSYLDQGFIKERFAQQKLNQLLGGVMGETFMEADEEGRAKILKKYVLRASGILGATQ